MFVLLALLLGVVSGLRSMLPLAALSWAARLGWISVLGTPLAFMGFRYTAIVFTVLAIGELIVDKLPATGSRKALGPFAARILCGGLAGATIGAASGSLALGLITGAAGAVLGTLGGAAFRARLASLFKKDLPAALLEDTIAILLAFAVVARY